MFDLGDGWKLMGDEEFRKNIGVLQDEVRGFLESKDLRIDYVVPILRSGAVPATYLANQLGIVKMAPIQLKLVKGENEPRVLLNSLSHLLIEKKNPVFLVVDGLNGRGKTAKKAVEIIRHDFPEAVIIFAVLAFRKSAGVPVYFFQQKSAYEIPEDEQLMFTWEVLEQQINHPDDLLENIYY